MKSLYHITQEHQKIIQELEDAILHGDLTPEQMDDLNHSLTINADEFAVKAQAYADTISSKTAYAKYLKAEAARLTAMAKQEESGANRLHEEISKAMQVLGITQSQLDHNKLSFRTSEAVEVSIEATLLPKEYQRMKIVYEADKDALKKALKANQIIEGVTLVERQNLQIK